MLVVCLLLAWSLWLGIISESRLERSRPGFSGNILYGGVKELLRVRLQAAESEEYGLFTIISTVVVML